MSCKTLKKENQTSNQAAAAGIVSLLSLAGKDGGFFPEKPPRSDSLRRTVSAQDIISSKHLMKQHNSKEDAPPPPPPMMANDEISVNSGPTSDNEEEDDHKKQPSQMDIWSSIQSNKEVAASATALLSSAPAVPKPQYVHPLVRRNSSSLSEKSLEMCTESLGSETGSDCPFSFCSALFEDDHHGLPPDQDEKEEEAPPRTVKYNCSVSRRLPAKPFPPPLTSISRRDGGPCLHMKPHRRNGRLVLQAVSVRSHSYLHAERHDGRLLLSFVSTPEEDEEEEFVQAEQDQSDEQVGGEHVGEIDSAAVKEEIEGEEEEEEDICSRDTWWRKEAPVVAEVHRSIGQAAHRPMVMNMNPWATKTEKCPSPDRALGLVGARVANGLNVYEYCWRSGGGGLGQRDVKQLGKRPSHELASPAARCFEPRRAHTLWILERYCVATS